jgi:hydrogenase nickel incorporation protein HypA/HybF
MHEHSLVEAIMERVVAEASARNALSVHRVSVRVGALAGVEPELLVTAFEIWREGTVCSGAVLDVVRVQAEWVCVSCRLGVPDGEALACLLCGGNVRLAAGDELLLDRIEMEVP